MTDSAILNFRPPVPLVRELMREYAQQLGVDLCFQDFETELEQLPGRYASPSGGLIVGYVGEAAAGCGAFRCLSDDVCEMKRLYTRPAFRRLGLGRQIAIALMSDAHRAGYQVMRLDTLSSMRSATMLYKALGFRQIAPYYTNPIAGALFLEVSLTANAIASLSLQVL